MEIYGLDFAIYQNLPVGYGIALPSARLVELSHASLPRRGLAGNAHASIKPRENPARAPNSV
jgi:hypothetical protein